MNLIISLLTFTVCAVSSIPWEPELRNEDWWLARHEEYVQNSLNNNGTQVIFFGDSITQDWSGTGRETFEAYYAPLGTANYGIGSDRTENVLWRIKNGEVANTMNTKVCVIKIGTNNIFDYDATSVAMGVVFNVIELREKLPSMKILVLGVLPRSDEAATQRTSAVNGILKRLDNGSSVRFLDMKEHFYKGNGEFYTELYTSDLLHLTAAGYQKWAQVMDPIFQEMLNN